MVINSPAPKTDPEEGNNLSKDSSHSDECGSCAGFFIIYIVSIIMIVITFPFSLLFCFKMVQEYERAIILRLGRVRPGGVVGPGILSIKYLIVTFRH